MTTRREFLSDPSHRIRQTLQVRLIAPTPDDIPHFGTIRRNQGCAGIERIIVALRIDQNRFPGSTRQTNHLDHMGQPALAVIGKQDGIKFRQTPLECR